MGLPHFIQAPCFPEAREYWREHGRNEVKESVSSTPLCVLPAEAAPLSLTRFFPHFVFLARLAMAFYSRCPLI